MPVIMLAINHLLKLSQAPDRGNDVNMPLMLPANISNALMPKAKININNAAQY
jgi:hypothetical protein